MGTTSSTSPVTAVLPPVNVLLFRAARSYRLWLTYNEVGFHSGFWKQRGARSVQPAGASVECMHVAQWLPLSSARRSAAKKSLLRSEPRYHVVCEGSSPSLALSYEKYREQVTSR